MIFVSSDQISSNGDLIDFGHQEKDFEVQNTKEKYKNRGPFARKLLTNISQKTVRGLFRIMDPSKCLKYQGKDKSV